MKKCLFMFLLLSVSVLGGCKNSVEMRQPAGTVQQQAASSSTETKEPAEDSSVESEESQEVDQEIQDIFDPWGNNEQIHLLENREDVVKGEVVEIPEKLFVAQVNDIYLNHEDYLDKTIKYEGFYTFYTEPDGSASYDYIGRNGPGCCANDSIVGFEVIYDGEMPQANDWVEVSGHIDILEDVGVLVLRVDSMEVKEERGLEDVTP